MSQTYSLEFPTVTQQVFFKLAGQLKTSAKITVEPNGDLEISRDGIEAEAHYDPSTQILTVNVLDKPWYVTVSNIKTEITKALLAAQQS